ncbi:uncharacterized protein LOC128553559 [Mercenaria mercenaria]|uniref:uncharacterized protein LOC128553559 n=1 Tax=Mercenaria mercenaria TaxID=6596 RepID=UPI00234F8A23|nr:uncharacterized protein LOC128553559 [Mercenaria mercenaria]
MSDFPTDSIQAEEIAAKWHKHAQANDMRSQSMKLPQTKPKTESSRSKASQSMMVHSESKKEKVSGANISNEFSRFVPQASKPPISGNDLKKITEACGEEGVQKQERRKCENKVTRTTNW